VFGGVVVDAFKSNTHVESPVLRRWLSTTKDTKDTRGRICEYKTNRCGGRVMNRPRPIKRRSAVIQPAISHKYFYFVSFVVKQTPHWRHDGGVVFWAALCNRQ